jgi:hypothetical protein
VILEWEWRPESSGCPPGFTYFVCDFRHFVLEFFPIFRSSYDLIFLEFESIPSDEFLGIGMFLVEFHLDKFWGRFMEFWVGFG